MPTAMIMSGERIRGTLCGQGLARSACRAARTRRGVARRRLAGRQRLAALDPQVAFADAMVDEIPRQGLVLGVGAMDVRVGVRQIRQTVALPLADGPPPVAAALLYGFDEARDAAVAARQDGLQIRLARRLDIEL